MLEVIHYVGKVPKRLGHLPKVAFVGLRQGLKSSPAGQALDKLFCTACHWADTQYLPQSGQEELESPS